MPSVTVNRVKHGLALGIVPYLFWNFSVVNGPGPWSSFHSWADWLQPASGALILVALIMVCNERRAWAEWALVIATLACGITETVYLWLHRERESTHYAGFPMWLVIAQTVFTVCFGLGVIAALVLTFTTRGEGDDEGLTGEGDVRLPDANELPTTPRDVIGGHRTILYRWAGYIAAIQATFTGGMLFANPPSPHVRTATSVLAVLIAIGAVFFLVTYGNFAVMRGPWSTDAQEKFYLRAKIALGISVLFTAASAPFTFPHGRGYGDVPSPVAYFAWSLSIAGAVGVLVMLGVIIRFERRGISLGDDEEEA